MLRERQAAILWIRQAIADHALSTADLGLRSHRTCGPAEWTSWLAAVNAADLEPTALLTFNTYDTAIAAAVAGQGWNTAIRS